MEPLSTDIKSFTWKSKQEKLSIHYERTGTDLQYYQTNVAQQQ